MAIEIRDGKLYAEQEGQDLLLRFHGFPAGEDDQIRTILADIYLNSTTAQQMLDEIPDLMAADGPGLDFIHVAERSLTGAGADLINKDVYINLEMGGPDETVYQYIDQYGTINTVSFERILVHEMVHAIRGLRDPEYRNSAGDLIGYTTPNFNHRGDTVDLTNTIMEELDTLSRDRTSYHMLGFNDDYMAKYVGVVDYTPRSGAIIDQTIIDYHGRFDIVVDQSLDTIDVQELILGLEGDDVINAGPGDDFVYGGEGSDTLIGGQGDDYLHGADPDGADSSLQDSVDTVDYSTSTGAVTVDLEAEEASDGMGGTDQLFSIERVIGSDFDDTFWYSDVQNFFEGRGGNDDLYGGGGGDELYGGEGADYLDGGGGDILVGGGGSDRLFGRDGDVLDGGAGNDVIVGGRNSTITYVFSEGSGHDELRGSSSAEFILDGSGIELIWDFVEEVLNYPDFDYELTTRNGDAAFVNASGDTLFIGNLSWERYGPSEVNDWVNVTFNGQTTDSEEAFRDRFNLSSMEKTHIPESYKTARDEYEAAREGGAPLRADGPPLADDLLLADVDLAGYDPAVDDEGGLDGLFTPSIVGPGQLHESDYLLI